MKTLFFLPLVLFLALAQLPQFETLSFQHESTFSKTSQPQIQTANFDQDDVRFNLEIQEELETTSGDATAFFFILKNRDLKNVILHFASQAKFRNSFLSYYSLFTNSPPQFI